MKPLPTNNLKAEIRKCLSEAGAGYFDIQNDNKENLFLCDTRQNGNVGREEPGEADIKAAKKALPILRTKFPNAEVSYETVDEWVHINVRFPIALFLCDEDAMTILKEAVEYHFIRAFNAIGANLPTEAGEVSRRKETWRDEDNHFFSFTMKSKEALFVEEDSYPPKRIRSWVEPELTVTAFTKDQWEYLMVQMRDHKFQVELENLEDIPKKLPTLVSQLVTEIGKHGRFRNDLWRRATPEERGFLLEEVKTSEFVGNGGYEEIWEKTKFFLRKNGDYILVDETDNLEKGIPDIWLIPKNEFESATRNLTSNYFPQIPEGCVPVESAIAEIVNALRDKLAAEVKAGKTDLLTSHGKAGDLVTAHDGTIYLKAYPVPPLGKKPKWVKDRSWVKDPLPQTAAK